MAPFKWRKNSTEEVRHMRNQRKKRKRLQKKNIPSVTVAKENYERLIQKEKAQKGRFLFLARKYYLKWKAVKEAHRNLHAKANPTNVVCGSGLKFVNGARLLSVTTAGNICNGISEISRNLLVAARDKKGNESKEFLGEGTFGKCFKMYFKGMPVAVKEFNNLSTAEAVRHEALVMSKCCHPSLPHLFGINVMKKPYVLVSYFYGIHDTSCTLHRALHSGSISLTYLSAMNILLKVCQAVEHLHSKQFLHCDIKINNIVLTKVNSDYHPLLIDFGKAISVSEARLRRKTLNLQEQAEYRRKYRHIAPEIVNGQAPSCLSDIYSVGVLMADVSGKIPSERTFCDLQVKCLQKEPSLRCPVSHILSVLNRIVKINEEKSKEHKMAST